MKLDLREIVGPRARVRRALSAESLTPPEGGQYRVSDIAALDLLVRKDGAKYRLAGRLDAGLDIECGRCLEPFRLAVGVDIDLLYLPATANSVDGDIRVEEPDLNTGYYRDDQIDLGQLVQEQFQLALPMKPLCGDDCRGLCVVCGGNRNRVTCQCAETWEDPRFAGLKRLLQ